MKWFDAELLTSCAAYTTIGSEFGSAAILLEGMSAGLTDINANNRIESDETNAEDMTTLRGSTTNSAQLSEQARSQDRLAKRRTHVGVLAQALAAKSIDAGTERYRSVARDGIARNGNRAPLHRLERPAVMFPAEEFSAFFLTVQKYFCRWRDAGLLEFIIHRLAAAAREKAGARGAADCARHRSQPVKPQKAAAYPVMTGARGSKAVSATS